MVMAHFPMPIKTSCNGFGENCLQDLTAFGVYAGALTVASFDSSLSCDSRNANEMLFQLSLSRMSAGAANRLFQMRSKTE